MLNEPKAEEPHPVIEPGRIDWHPEAVESGRLGHG
jgi:hypothetical protein